MQTYDITQREHQEAWSAGTVLNCVTIRVEPREIRHTHLNHYGYCHFVYTPDPRHVLPTRDNGFKVGGLWVFVAAHDPVEQAEQFAKLVTVTDLLPAVELPTLLSEWSEEIGVLEKADYAAQLREFLDAAEATIGRKVLIKTSADYWRDHVDSDAFGANPLWVVDYATYADEGHKAAPVLPRGWAKYVLWEFTDAGHNGQGWRGVCDFSLATPAALRTLVLE